MALAQGTQVYQCDTTPVTARGITFTNAELNDAINNRLPPLLNDDDEGSKQVQSLLGSIASTQFEAKEISQILKAKPVAEDWRVRDRPEPHSEICE